MPNRITAAVARQTAAIQDRINSGAVTAAQVAKCEADANLSPSEHARFQTLKSVVMGSILTPDEAQSLYCYLGETVAHFNGQPLGVRVTCLKLFSELLVRTNPSLRAMSGR